MDSYYYTKGSEFEASAPIRRAFDITLSSTPLALPTRYIMVSASGTVTGEFVGDKGTSTTTFPLTAGVLYPFAFYKITAVSNAITIKGYA